MIAPSPSWAEDMAQAWRAQLIAVYSARAAAGEIPSAQVSILADMGAAALKVMLLNAASSGLKDR